MTNATPPDLKEFLQNLADDDCFSDNEFEDDCLEDFAGGNVDDAFKMGENEGRVQLSRQLLQLFFKE